MATRMPNPSAVPLVDRAGRLTPEWVRWLQDLSRESATTTEAAAPAPAPAPAPDPGPVTAGLVSALALDIAGLQQLPLPPDAPPLGDLQQAPGTADHDARIAALESAVNDIRQGSQP